MSSSIKAVTRLHTDHLLLENICVFTFAYINDPIIRTINVVIYNI